MEGRTIQSNEHKSQENKVTVVCSWTYSKEAQPSFYRLMRRLIQPRADLMEMDNGHEQES